MTIEEVKKSLKEACAKDQAIRLELEEQGDTQELLDRMDAIDIDNNKLIRELFKEHGLITIFKFGEDASSDAFFMVQHMLREDLDFMKEYLGLMEKNLADVSKEEYALLKDRVLVYSGKPQLYGTQLDLNKTTGKYEPTEIADPSNVNARREKFGLGTLEEYLAEIPD